MAAYSSKERGAVHYSIAKGQHYGPSFEGNELYLTGSSHFLQEFRFPAEEVLRLSGENNENRKWTHAKYLISRILLSTS